MKERPEVREHTSVDVKLIEQEEDSRKGVAKVLLLGSKTWSQIVQGVLATC